MQTFLPYQNFEESAKVLDYRRLGKQRVEAYQIIRTLEGISKGWCNHPAIKMWRGYTDALKAYHNAMVGEWIKRGFRNTMRFYDLDSAKVRYPSWLGNKDFHSYHRATLLYKNFEWYSRFGWSEKPKHEYIWPV